MKLRYRFLVLLIAAFVCCSRSALAETEAVVPDENGLVIVDGELINYTGKGGKVIIPSTVTKIVGVFNEVRYKKPVTVQIPTSVTEISDSFNGDVVNVTFEDRKKKELVIGDSCFNASWQERLDLPEGTTSIGKNCFSDSEYVAMPSSVKYIASWKYEDEAPVIICKKGTYAEKYAKVHKLTYEEHFHPYLVKARKSLYTTVGNWLDIEYKRVGIDDGLIKFKSDNPEILKVEKDKYWRYPDLLKFYGKKPGKATVTMTCGSYQTTITVEVLKWMEDNVKQEILHNATHPSMTDFQKAYGVAKFMTGFAEYDFQSLYTGKYSHKYSPHTAKSFFLERIAVCDGNALAYQQVLKKLGIETKVVYGNYGGAHAWNLVKIGNQWSHVDITNGFYFLADSEMSAEWNKKLYPKAKFKCPEGYYKGGD